MIRRTFSPVHLIERSKENKHLYLILSLLLCTISAVHSFAIPLRKPHKSRTATTSKARFAASSSLYLPRYEEPSLWKNDTSIDYARRIPLPSLLRRSRRRVPIPPRNNNKYRVFCDLDGVLVDFCHGISQAFPDSSNTSSSSSLNSQNVDAIPRHELWKRVQSVDAFFEHLPWCPGGRELWEAIAGPLRPDILTGVPSYCDRAPRDEKFAWCVRELATATELVSFQHVDKAGRLRQHYPVKNEIVQVLRGEASRLRTPTGESCDDDDDDDDKQDEWNCRVITCWSERKHHESGKNAVLIDDRIDLKEPWENAGGIFIHHVTGDTPATLRQLVDHGILPRHSP